MLSSTPRAPWLDRPVLLPDRLCSLKSFTHIQLARGFIGLSDLLGNLPVEFDPLWFSSQSAIADIHLSYMFNV